MRTIGTKDRISLVLFLCMALAGAAQSLDDYLQLAARNNPSIKAAHLKYQAALEKAPQVAGLPDPTLSASAFGTAMTTDMGEERARFELMQMFPWFGTLEARKEVANFEAQAQYLSYVSNREQLFLEVKTEYAKLYQVKKSIEFQKENLRILDTYYDLAMSKFRSGVSPMVNVVRVEISQDAARTQLKLLEQNFEALQSAFNLLLNRDIRAGVAIQDTLGLQLTKELETVPHFDDHPRMQQLDKQQDSYEARKMVAQKEGLPSFGLGVGYVVNAKSSMGMPEMNGKDAVMPMFSMSLPIFRNKHNANKNQADLMAQSIELEKKQQANEFQSEFQLKQYELHQAQQLLELYQRQIESSERARTLLVSSFSANTGDFEEILRINQDILMFKLQGLEALKSGFTAQANIEYLLTNEFIAQQKN